MHICLIVLLQSFRHSMRSNNKIITNNNKMAITPNPNQPTEAVLISSHSLSEIPM